MHYYKIFEKAKENEYFREVLATSENTQVVVMSIEVGGEIGEETHDKEDQVLIFIEGEGKAIVGGIEQEIGMGDLVLVPKGTVHNFVNTGDTSLKLFTTYSPPHHPKGTIHKTMADAQKAEY